MLEFLFGGFIVFTLCGAGIFAFRVWEDKMNKASIDTARWNQKVSATLMSRQAVVDGVYDYAQAEGRLRQVSNPKEGLVDFMLVGNDGRHYPIEGWVGVPRELSDIPDAVGLVQEARRQSAAISREVDRRVASRTASKQ